MSSVIICMVLVAMIIYISFIIYLYLDHSRIRYLFMRKRKNDKYIDTKSIINSVSEKPIFKFKNKFYLKNEPLNYYYFISMLDNEELCWVIVDNSIKLTSLDENDKVVVYNSDTKTYYMATKSPYKFLLLDKEESNSKLKISIDDVLNIFLDDTTELEKPYKFIGKVIEY